MYIYIFIKTFTFIHRLLQTHSHNCTHTYFPYTQNTCSHTYINVYAHINIRIHTYTLT